MGDWVGVIFEPKEWVRHSGDRLLLAWRVWENFDWKGDAVTV